MNVPHYLGLQRKSDAFSQQVISLDDHLFWFRLERGQDRDIISDYTLGSYPKESAGRILVECYKILGISPKKIIVFQHIMRQSAYPHPLSLTEAQSFYVTCGRALFQAFGAVVIDERLEIERDKYQLVLVGEMPTRTDASTAIKESTLDPRPAHLKSEHGPNGTP